MPHVAKRDYYDTLGVERTASDDDVKKAFRKLARQYHPDLHTGEQQKKQSEEKFKEINEAYEILSDQEKRKRYDMFGHAGTQGAGGAEGFDFGRGGFGDIFNDIFEDFFSGGGPGRQRRERGSDLQYNLEVSFEEAISGKEAKLKIPRWELCGECRGTGARGGSALKVCPSCRAHAPPATTTCPADTRLPSSSKTPDTAPSAVSTACTPTPVRNSAPRLRALLPSALSSAWMSSTPPSAIHRARSPARR